jgi:hypothetical protein
VGKILDGGWLDFAFLPLASKGFAYSNLLVVFALIALLGAALYFRGDRRAKVAVSGVEILGDSNCIEPSGC